jgi:tetratricopeptide (TPR) repeat protein
VVSGGIFISYRGDDSRSYAALLFSELARQFGSDSVFLDSESIPAGSDFRDHLIARVRNSAVVLAVIGPRWLVAAGTNEGVRKIDEPQDWLRRELAEAFFRGIPVVPVLTDGAEMPRAGDLPAELTALARCQYRRLRRRDASGDIARLVADLTAISSTLAAAARLRDSSSRRRPIQPITGRLAAWGVRQALRDSDAFNSNYHASLDSALDELHSLVTQKLAKEPALAMLEAAPDAVQDRTARRLESAINAAARTDPQFAAALDHALTKIERAETVTGVKLAGRTTATFSTVRRTSRPTSTLLAISDREAPSFAQKPGTQGGAVGARKTVERAVATVRELSATVGPDHPDTLTARNNLAAAYQLAGRSREAIELYESVLSDSIQVLGSDHPDTLTTRNNLAAAYRLYGRNRDAIQLYENIVLDSTQALGSDHPNTLTARNNLAVAYQASGDLTLAIHTFEQTLADLERVLGVGHPDTIRARNSLANAYGSSGYPRGVVALFGDALADSERYLGPDDPETVLARSNLAKAYLSIGDYKPAIALLEQVLADSERVLGPDHPDTLTTRTNLATAYESIGDSARAIRLLEQVLADSERVLGPDHPDTLTTRRNLGRLERRTNVHRSGSHDTPGGRDGR